MLIMQQCLGKSNQFVCDSLISVLLITVIRKIHQSLFIVYYSLLWLPTGFLATPTRLAPTDLSIFPLLPTAHIQTTIQIFTKKNPESC